MDESGITQCYCFWMMVMMIVLPFPRLLHNDIFEGPGKGHGLYDTTIVFLHLLSLSHFVLEVRLTSNSFHVIRSDDSLTRREIVQF